MTRARSQWASRPGLVCRNWNAAMGWLIKPRTELFHVIIVRKLQFDRDGKGGRLPRVDVQ
ncbi:hypothetical protein B0T26DRAFT_422170 [Lasiosphaeria miniovina]|uniref:Uncharacterized protein n=1 Tax=Lasiosphaeria miniovina TaxID=1954250 RepID=A0AA40A5Y3_9PEZI|nr:uncharacterized protein B0T26DRAFT_422170 [Lasiosphaeria miniovina]KAK0709753.1 hypothetical protein B0T26DRAFT_422170 [Lasiosphaeria miniovina]